MDPSPLTEAQQQQIQQLQKYLLEQLQHLQQHAHENPQQSQHSEQQQQQLQDHNNTHSPNANHQSQQLEQANHPISAGHEAPSEVVESSGLEQGQVQQNADSVSAGAEANAGIPGINPAAAAAVAALAQLTQFAGTMGAAERAMLGLGFQGSYGNMMGPGQGPMPFPVDRSSYRGGGRRGRGPSRGGPPFRGRGRGQGRGGPRHYPPSHNTSSSQEPSAAEVAGPTEEQPEPSADNRGSEALAEVPHQAFSSAHANAAPTRIGWCELCKVQCTSLEILEQQHKTGKRHKKNLQKLGDLKTAFEPVTEVQNENKSVADSYPEVSLQPESLPTEAVTDENTMETNDQVRNPFDNQRRGMKRKMRGGREGKRVKNFDGTNQPNEPHKPKVVIPLICDLCNVKCDTKEVFDRHLAGKKHISKVKRFEGHQAMYGPMGLQALYPPNPITQTLFNPQGTQQGLYDPQGSYPPPGAYIPSQAYYAAPVATGTDAGSGFQQNPGPQASGVTPNLGAQN